MEQKAGADRLKWIDRVGSAALHPAVVPDKSHYSQWDPLGAAAVCGAADTTGSIHFRFSAHERKGITVMWP